MCPVVMANSSQRSRSQSARHSFRAASMQFRDYRREFASAGPRSERAVADVRARGRLGRPEVWFWQTQRSATGDRSARDLQLMGARRRFVEQTSLGREDPCSTFHWCDALVEAKPHLMPA